MTGLHIATEALIVGLVILGTVVLIDNIKQAIKEEQDDDQ